MYLLDTNVISELRKVGQGKADVNVMSWQSGVTPELLFISVITQMELEWHDHRHPQRAGFFRPPGADTQPLG